MRFKLKEQKKVTGDEKKDWRMGVRRIRKKGMNNGGRIKKEIRTRVGAK